MTRPASRRRAPPQNVARGNGTSPPPTPAKGAARRAARRPARPLPAALACLALHVLAQRPIDACLIAFIGFRVALEPGDDVGVEAKCQLLLDGSIEQPTFRAGPIEEFRRVRRVNGAIG